MITIDPKQAFIATAQIEAKQQELSDKNEERLSEKALKVL